jgi:hypothetical protein
MKSFTTLCTGIDNKRSQPNSVTHTGRLRISCIVCLFSLILIMILVGCHKSGSSKPSSIKGSAPATSVSQSAAQVCKPLLPICPGGLISQHATPAQINARLNVLPVPLTCRFQQPTKCFAGEKLRCPDTCTP